MHSRHLVILAFVVSLAASGLTACETSESGGKTEANGESQAASEQAGQPSAESDESSGAQSDETADEEVAADDQAPEAEELALPNQARPMDGIITAAQPSKEQFDKLDEAGVTHVINFRTSDEDGTWDEAAKSKEMGIGYTQIPVSGPQDLTRENVEAFDTAMESAEGDVLVHCGSSNRVGAMFALRAFWIQGEGIDQALEIGKKAGMTSLEAAVREKLE